jgi:hypothetical protein
MDPPMDPIDKKQLKKLDCPKCNRPKLRFAHSKDAATPDGCDGPDRDIYCDNCRTNMRESDDKLQAQWRQLKADRTPAPVVQRH